MDEIRIRRMAAADEQAVGDILGFAFADQPNTLAVTRGDVALARHIAFEGMRIATLGRTHKNLWVAEDTGSDGVTVVGALNAVEWPHCQMSTAEKLRTAPPMLLTMGMAVPRGFRIMSAWGKRDPRERHWHIGPVGVQPDLQGRGIGTSLMASFLELVDEQRSPAYLETDRERNLAFYQRFGFAVVAEEDILGVRNWYMWREARTS
jgi:ribosomal protein S18 acetylase RimI-like enzyme